MSQRPVGWAWAATGTAVRRVLPYHRRSVERCLDFDEEPIGPLSKDPKGGEPVSESPRDGAGNARVVHEKNDCHVSTCQ